MERKIIFVDDIADRSRTVNSKLVDRLEYNWALEYNCGAVVFHTGTFDNLSRMVDLSEKSLLEIYAAIPQVKLVSEAFGRQD